MVAIDDDVIHVARHGSGISPGVKVELAAMPVRYSTLNSETNLKGNCNHFFVVAIFTLL